MTAQALGSGRHHRTLDEPAAVRFTPAGSPLAVRWHGSIWQVVDTPKPGAAGPRSERAAASPPEQPAAGTTTSRWQFLAQTGPASPVLEFDLRWDTRRKEWRLVGVGAQT
jgi:hypothetical protein